MSSSSPTSIESLKSIYQEAGQGHVLTFWDTLNPTEQSTFQSQLSTINPSKVNTIFQAANKAAELEASSPNTDISPPPSERVGSVLGDNSNQASKWNEIGLKAVREGKVGVLLMAGGQGTRLGSSDPKGCFDIGMPSKKSLFQLQAERIRRLEVLGGSGKKVPWYIMTSGPTRKPTEDFFQKHSYFGLEKENVIFFEQGKLISITAATEKGKLKSDPFLFDCFLLPPGVLPCFTNEGKFFLDTKSSIAVAPDGNGGIYAGLLAPLSSSSPNSVLSDLASRGITYLHAYCVDNCLVRVADPIFMGYCIEKNADCGAKVVKKLVPEEAVGVVALKGGKFSVVEYSEIPKALSEERVNGESEGDLVFRAANIANHFYTLDFLNDVENFQHEMAYHIARKKIPHTDLTTGQLEKPSKPNGMKLELFVFDVFPFTKSMAILEVDRSTDFSPLKNASGTGADDPETSRRDLLKEQRRWLEEAGATIEDGVEIEISPLVSYAGDGLVSVKGKVFKRNGVVEKVEDFIKLE